MLLTPLAPLTSHVFHTAFANRVFTGKEVVLSAQVWFPGRSLSMDPSLLLGLQFDNQLFGWQVAAALFAIAKVGNWFTSLGLLYTGELHSV